MMRCLPPLMVFSFSVGTRMRLTRCSKPSILILRRRVCRTESSLLEATRRTNQFMPGETRGSSCETWPSISVWVWGSWMLGSSGMGRSLLAWRSGSGAFEDADPKEQGAEDVVEEREPEGNEQGA